jgi:hypothetical protein
LKFEDAGKKVDGVIEKLKEDGKIVKDKTKEKVDKGKEKIELLKTQQEREKNVRDLTLMIIEAKKQNKEMEMEEIIENLAKNDRFKKTVEKTVSLEEKIEEIKE